jgi:hypothetical protein
MTAPIMGTVICYAGELACCKHTHTQRQHVREIYTVRSKPQRCAYAQTMRYGAGSAQHTTDAVRKEYAQ